MFGRGKTANLNYMIGLYALKPRFAEALTGVRRWCIAAGVRPRHLTWLGVAAGSLAGVAVATRPAGLFTAAMVSALVVARLACANLDGGLARDTGASTRWGAVENELGDRLADLAMLVGLVAAASSSWANLSLPIDAGPELGFLVLLAATLPSWVALAVTAAGGHRINGGPMGKTERCAVVVVAALSGWYVAAIVVITIGSVWTALSRLAVGARELTGTQTSTGGVR
jgi:CDP-diacylglycerol--glycerol-3-phosphate 3-phosphatidyltransferase